MSKVSQFNWYLQRAYVSFACIALFIVLLIAGIALAGGVLYVSHKYLADMQWIDSKWVVLIVVAYVGSVVIGIGFACSALQRYLWERFGLGCTKCKKEFNWRQYVHRIEKGHCPLCLSSGMLPEPTAEFDTPAHVEPTSLDNPYAAPSAASYVATPVPSGDGFIEPLMVEEKSESLFTRVMGFVLMPLWSGLLLTCSPLLVVIMIASYFNAVFGSLHLPRWLRLEFRQKRWSDMIGVASFLLWILVISGALFAVGGSFSVWTWSFLNFWLIAWFVCTIIMILPMVSLWFVKRTAPTSNPAGKAPGNFIVTQDETEHYRLTLHWPAEAKFEQPPTLKFRTVTNHGLVLHVFDRVQKEVIHKQIFPAPHNDDWNELTFPMLQSPVNSTPIEQLYFVLDSLDRQPWLVPMADASVTQSGNASSL